MPAFHSDQRSDFSLMMNSFDVGGGQCEFESLRVTSDHVVYHVNLFQYRLNRGGPAQAMRDIDRPELPAYATRPEAGNVGHHRKLARVRCQINGAKVVAAYAVLPGHIVV